MKCSQIKETLKDAETQIRKLDCKQYKINSISIVLFLLLLNFSNFSDQILKAKQKLQILKSRKNILYAKLKIMKLAILEVRLKGNVKDVKQNKEIEQDLSHMLGNMLSIQNGV